MDKNEAWQKRRDLLVQLLLMNREREVLYETDVMFRASVEALVAMLDVFVDGLVLAGRERKDHPPPTEAEILKVLDSEMKLHAVEQIMDGVEAAFEIIREDEGESDE